MKNKKVNLIFLVIFMFVVGPRWVKADWAGCNMTSQNNQQVNVGETFSVDIGSNGITGQRDIYGVHYVIAYDDNILEPLINEITSYYNWEVRNNTVEDRQLIYKYLIVDM